MNQKLDLRAMGLGLAGFVSKDMNVSIRSDAEEDETILVLLKYLFTTVDMNSNDAKKLRFATTMHYQLVPNNTAHVAPAPAPCTAEFL